MFISISTPLFQFVLKRGPTHVPTNGQQPPWYYHLCYYLLTLLGTLGCICIWRYVQLYLYDKLIAMGYQLLYMISTDWCYYLFKLYFSEAYGGRLMNGPMILLKSNLKISWQLHQLQSSCWLLLGVLTQHLVEV